VNTQLLAKVDVLMEVSKANFSPPPKVDSSVVCITPQSSLLPVDRKEWDNFIRICFSRKNKTLGAIFRQKRVISILAGRKFGGLKDSDDESMTGECPNDDDDGIDDCNNSNYDASACNEELGVRNGGVIQSTEQLLQLKERVIGTLLMGGFENRRSVKLSQDDFIKLLMSFNEAGIRFA
jgi:18S rRNA (adenine1779-N6/adenine1780-N6)-dimethyltransferase